MNTTSHSRILPPRKPFNKERRTREFLTPEEIEKLIFVARHNGRYGHRNATMILMAYRHGLRVSELVALRWEQIDLTTGLLHVQRRKNGIDTTHPLFGPELRALRKLKRNYPDTSYVFISERRSPLTSSNFRKILTKIGKSPEISILLHPHMLRHSTGFKLANEGRDTRSIQQYLGHKNITHTSRYTEIAPAKFNDFWKD